MVKYFLVGGIWVCIMEGNGLHERTYNHIAFSVSNDELDTYAQRIKAAGVDVLPDRPRVPGKGRSIYFMTWTITCSNSTRERWKNA